MSPYTTLKPHSLVNAIHDSTSRISSADFHQLLIDSSEEGINPGDLNVLLDYASEQAAHWGAVFSFSPVHAPALDAHTEHKHWEEIWLSLAELLTQHADVSMAGLKELHVAMNEAYLLKWRMDLNRTNRLQQVVTSIKSKSAITLERLGFGRMAEGLYRSAIYPRGAVGRSLAGVR